MSNKYEKEYLKIVRTEPAPLRDEGLKFEEMKGTTFRERLKWRGIEAKSLMIGLTALSIMASTVVLLTLAVILGSLN
tara:strand:- start:625 stop:855 length:231 start_codon:yes stop_codon:yes gene_type:complete